MTAEIKDYAIIGDGRSCAPVSKAGSIDFLCWPRFDSEARLAALLGEERHGCYRIAPAGFVSETTRRYRDDAAILDTEHLTQTGRVRVTDLMPWSDGPSAIIRIVEGLEGEVEMALSLRLRFRYGQLAPWWQHHDRGAIFEVGPDRVALYCPFDVVPDDNAARARLTVAKGAKVAVVLNHSVSTSPAPPPTKVEALVSATEKESKRGLSRCKARAAWDAAIKRSLITLRLPIDRDSGGMVAAATFGLPEIPGGVANWDNSYCWLRDSPFTLTALLGPVIQRAGG